MFTAIDLFPQRLRQARGSVPNRAEVVRAIHRMLDALVREPRSIVVDSGAVVSNFNALLQQVKDQFRATDTLRLIEPLSGDASVALVAVRLSIVKRTIDAELAHAAEEAS